MNTNLDRKKLNNILKTRLITSDTNAKNLDKLYQLIVTMEEMDALVCRWEESSDCNKYKATPSGDWNTIAMVHSIVEHAPSEDCFLYAPLKSIHSSGEHIYAEMLAADWSWKTYGSFLVLSESLFLIRFSLCMGELQCQREHVREIMGE